MSDDNPLLNLALKGVPEKRIVKQEFSLHEEELVLAWVDDKITLAQVGLAMAMTNNSNSYPFLARVCKQILKRRNKS